jgi:hypothetical protein
MESEERRRRVSKSGPECTNGAAFSTILREARLRLALRMKGWG